MRASATAVSAARRTVAATKRRRSQPLRTRAIEPDRREHPPPSPSPPSPSPPPPRTCPTAASSTSPRGRPPRSSRRTRPQAAAAASSLPMTSRWRSGALRGAHRHREPEHRRSGVGSAAANCAGAARIRREIRRCGAPPTRANCGRHGFWGFRCHAPSVDTALGILRGDGSHTWNADDDELERLLQVAVLNAIELTPPGSARRRYGLCARGSLFNHSCQPNATHQGFVVGDGGGACLCVRAVRDIRKGEEVTISYVADLADAHGERAEQLKHHGFGAELRPCDAPLDEWLMPDGDERAKRTEEIGARNVAADAAASAAHGGAATRARLRRARALRRAARARQGRARRAPRAGHPRAQPLAHVMTHGGRARANALSWREAASAATRSAAARVAGASSCRSAAASERKGRRRRGGRGRIWRGARARPRRAADGVRRRGLVYLNYTLIRHSGVDQADEEGQQRGGAAGRQRGAHRGHDPRAWRRSMAVAFETRAEALALAPSSSAPPTPRAARRR